MTIIVSPDAAQEMNIYQRMFSAAMNLGYIEKDGKNTFQKFNFASHDAVVGACRKVFLEWGILCLNDVELSEREKTILSSGSDKEKLTSSAWLRIKTTLINPDTPDDRFSVHTETEAQDTSDKAYGKAISYAKKYALLTGCGLMLETGEDADEPQSRELKKVVKLFTGAADKIKADKEWQCAIIDAGELGALHDETSRLKELHAISSAFDANCKAHKIPLSKARILFSQAMTDDGLNPFYIQNPDQVKRTVDRIELKKDATTGDAGKEG